MNIYAPCITFQEVHVPLVTNVLMELVFLGQILAIKHLSAWMEPIHLLCVVSQT